MLKTVEAEIDVNGSIVLLEPVNVTKKTRAIVTLLEEANGHGQERKGNSKEILEFLKNNRLPESAPTSTDWWETAQSIRRLYINKTAPVSKLKTLQNDALIARLAVKNGGFVVTMDIDDFLLIKREMPKLEVVSGDYFFS